MDYFGTNSNSFLEKVLAKSIEGFYLFDCAENIESALWKILRSNMTNLHFYGRPGRSLSLEMLQFYVDRHISADKHLDEYKLEMYGRIESYVPNPRLGDLPSRYANWRSKW
ncbi:hypothetical protein L596_025875 [Steinernema carpocapsae]|nr:hypothetical protein L596_025875 [Steinernema carpocapsae]